MATWKLDRRAAAGRSAQDVRAIGRAQGELKERVDRAAAQMREPRRRPRVVQGDAIGAAAADPMTSAAAAMGRAKAALDAVKTAEALPPEMEALNHLLRAQAEVKRREVMRQQANSGSSGGSNRAQQDLSTLFDRELQRQQQTNYETQKSTEERQDGSKDNSLDRVRELARRQEQLARQQEELAQRSRAPRAPRRSSGASNGSRVSSRSCGSRQKSWHGRWASSRRGSRRNRGSAISRTTQGQQSQGQPQGDQASGERAQTQRQGQSTAGQSTASSGSELREASEEMRGAASDLRRQDPRQASARSSRALERLRSLERQLQATAARRAPARAR